MHIIAQVRYGRSFVQFCVLFIFILLFIIYNRPDMCNKITVLQRLCADCSTINVCSELCAIFIYLFLSHFVSLFIIYYRSDMCNTKTVLKRWFVNCDKKKRKVGNVQFFLIYLFNLCCYYLFINIGQVQY